MDWALLTSSIALVIATAALVSATFRYTKHTAQLVEETRANRLLSIAPRIAVTVGIIGPTHANLRIVNVGQGAAIDVEVWLAAPMVGDQRHWRSPLLAPGQHADLLMGGAGGALMSLEDASKATAVWTINGRARDIAGNEHSIHDELAVAPWWESVTSSVQSYDTPLLQDIRDEIKHLREAVEKLRPPESRSVR